MHPGPLDLLGLRQEGCEVPDVPGAVQEAHDAERGGGGFGQGTEGLELPLPGRARSQLHLMWRGKNIHCRDTCKIRHVGAK